MQILFSVPGAPQGKARAKTVRTKNGMSLTYTPDKTVAYEELVRQRYQNIAGEKRFLRGEPLNVTIVAHFQVPKSKSKKIKALMISRAIRPTTKPDWDNIGKIICDALNGMAYNDDSQIVSATVSKVYVDDNPHVMVEIKDVDTEGKS